VDLLADRPQLLTPLAHLRWIEWGNEPGREQLQWWANTAIGESGRDTPPVAFVASTGAGAGEILGGVSLAPLDLPERQDRSPWVVGTIVRADRRGQGIGQALMARLELWAAHAGITQAWVATGGPAIEFYRNCGWTIVEFVTVHDGEQATILTKTFSPTTPGATTAG
jgi:GNAT superfamily N-acetyltransferase